MSQKVNIDLVNIQTKQVENSVKNLKQKIKELKDELAETGLETDEAKAKLQELGELMHTQAEITELARLESTDYGDTLASVTKASAGLVAGIQAVNSVMILTGNTSEEVGKSLQTMTALMSLTQVLGTFDTAEKSFQSLWGKIKQNVKQLKEKTQAEINDTNAVNVNTIATNQNANAIQNQTNKLSTVGKGLKIVKNGFQGLTSSIMNFVKANPFTFIITSVVGAKAAIDSYRAKQQQMIEETIDSTGKAYEAINKMNNAYTGDSLHNQAQASTILQLENDVNRITKEIEKTTSTNNFMGERNLKALTDRMNDFALATRKSNEELIKAKETGKEQTKIDKLQQKYNEDRKLFLEAEYNYLTQIIYKEHDNLVVLEEGTKAYDKQNAVLEKNVTALNKNLETQKTYYNKIEEIEKTKKEKQKEDADKFYQKQLDDLNKKLEEELLINTKWHTTGIRTTKMYYQDIIKWRQWYFDELSKLEETNPKVTEKEIVNAEIALLEAEKQLAQYEIDFRKLSQVDNLLFLTADEAKTIQQSINRLYEDFKKIEEQRNKLNSLSTREAYEEILKWNKKTEEEELLHVDNLLQIEQEYYETQNKLLKDKYEQENTINTVKHQQELKELKERVENGLLDMNEAVEMRKKLIKEYENTQAQLKYDYALAQLQLSEELASIELDYSQQRLQITENEINRKIELQQKYYDAYTNIYSNLSGFIREIQSGFDANSKEYKAIQKTMIIADTITASMSAYKSGVQSGLPAPWNLIYGGTLAGLATATGVIQLQNLENETISTTSNVSNLNTNPYETISYSTLSNIEGNILDSKVYVVESEIQATGRRVRTTESEAMF